MLESRYGAKTIRHTLRVHRWECSFRLVHRCFLSNNVQNNENVALHVLADPNLSNALFLMLHHTEEKRVSSMLLGELRQSCPLAFQIRASHGYFIRGR